MELDKEPTSNTPNAVSISDAETESGDEHDNDTNEPEEQEEETAPPVAKKHGKEREGHGCKSLCPFHLNLRRLRKKNTIINFVNG